MMNQNTSILGSKTLQLSVSAFCIIFGLSITFLVPKLYGINGIFAIAAASAMVSIGIAIFFKYLTG